MEIERKFLVNKDLINNVSFDISYKIKQGYLSKNSECSIRVRLIDSSLGLMTIKSKVKGISREEIEYEIPFKQGSELYEKFCKNKIKKTRSVLMYKDKKWEIDFFEDDNEGLIMAEIELTSENEEFEKPIWIEKEVSYTKKYYNAELARNPFKKWKRKNEK